MIWDAVVVGAGVQGLAAAYHLHHLGCRQIAIIDRRVPGHDLGSSHGDVRITRSSYPHVRYVQMMKQVMNHEWPEFERACGQTLIHPVVGCLFGPAGGAIEQYADAVTQAGADVELVDPDAARERFPQLSFNDKDRALIDYTSGVIFAQRAVKALMSINSRSGSHFMTNCRVRSVDFGRFPIRVYTADGHLDTNHAIITAGAWTGQLVPELAKKLVVKRQTVVYMVPEDSRDVSLESGYPVWIYLGANDNDRFYGVSRATGNSIKLARHQTAGDPDNPDYKPDSVDPKQIIDVEQFAARHLSGNFVTQHAEHCLYTNTETEDYVLDCHPHNKRVAVGAGFSGHGFKLAPLCGRILAELALEGESSVACFEAAREHFQIPSIL
jgi:monomeric sarcosine oxidase